MKIICYYCRKQMGETPGGPNLSYVTDMFPCLDCEEKMQAGVLIIPVKDVPLGGSDIEIFPDLERVGAPLFIPNEQIHKLVNCPGLDRLVMSRWAFVKPNTLTKIRSLLDD